jgi:hypothetical protein
MAHGSVNLLSGWDPYLMPGGNWQPGTRTTCRLAANEVSPAFGQWVLQYNSRLSGKEWPHAASAA